MVWSEGNDESMKVLLDSPAFSPCPVPPSIVYPSLESDEDDPALKSLPKKKKCMDDAPWSPKGNNSFRNRACAPYAGKACNSIS